MDGLASHAARAQDRGRPTIAALLAAAVVWGGLIAGCERHDADATDPHTLQTRAAPARPDARAVTERANGRDDEAMPEGLRLALDELRDKFRCNGVSGCPAADVIRGFGFVAGPYLVQLLELARPDDAWRPRAVMLLAELGAPRAWQALERLLDDGDPEVHAAALFGLAQLDRPRALELARPRSAGRPPPFLAGPQLTALWLLARGGEGSRGEAERSRALGALHERGVDLTAQLLAGKGIRALLGLCARADSPDCRPVTHAAAQHPTYHLRKAAAVAIAAHPAPADRSLLEQLRDDKVPSIRRLATTTLAKLRAR